MSLPQTQPTMSIGSGGIQDSLKGLDFQKNILMLFAVTGDYNQLDFELRTEIESAEKADDCVFIYKTSTGHKKVRLIQAKHKVRPSNMHLNFLLTNKAFLLYKYFITFVRSKKNFSPVEIEDIILATNNKIENIGNDQVEMYIANKMIRLEMVTSPDMCLTEIGVRYKLSNSSENFEFFKYYLISFEFITCLFTVNQSDLTSTKFPLLSIFHSFITSKLIDEATNTIKSSFIDGSDTEIIEFREIFSLIFNEMVNFNNDIKKKYVKFLRKEIWDFLKEKNKIKNLFQFYKNNQQNILTETEIDASIYDFLKKFLFLLNVDASELKKSTIKYLGKKFKNQIDNENFLSKLESIINKWIINLNQNSNPVTRDTIQNMCDEIVLTLDYNFINKRSEEIFSKSVIEFLQSDSDWCNDLIENSESIVLIIPKVEESFLISLKVYQKMKHSTKTPIYLNSNDIKDVVEKSLKVFQEKQDYCVLELLDEDWIYLNDFVTVGNVTLKKLIIVTTFDRIQLTTNFNKKCVFASIWNELTPNSKQKVLERTVIFQDRKIQLKQLIDDFHSNDHINEIINIDNISNSNFYKNLDSDLYVTRTLQRNIYINNDLLKDIQNDSVIDLIVFNKVDFDQKCLEFPNKNIHWINKSGSETIILGESNVRLEWRQSRREISNLYKYINDKESANILESKLTEIDSRVCIIVNNAGMGKTFLFQRLSKILSEKCPSYWVIPVILSNYCDQLEIFEGKTLTKADIMGFVENDVLKLNSIISKKLFDHACIKTENVFMFFDGYDEITKDSRKVVLDIINFFKTKTKSRVFISTRSEWKRDLENEFSEISYSLVPFSKGDQESYFKTFLNKRFKFDNVILNEIVNTILKISELNITKRDRELTGIPLITMLLAEYFQEKIKPQMSITNEEMISTLKEEKFNIFSLYQSLIGKMFKRHWEEKYYFGTSTPASKKQYKNYLETFKFKHGLFAIRYLFNESLCKKLPAKLTVILSENEKDELSECGIIFKFNDQFKFLHLTFVEYFATELLMNYYEETVSFIWETVLSLEGERYQFMRSIINFYFVPNSPNLSKKFLPENVFVQLCSESNSIFPIHLAAKEGNSEFFEFVIYALLKIPDKTIMKNIFLSRDSENLQILYYYLLNCDVSINIFDEIKKATNLNFIRDILMFTNKNDYFEGNVVIVSIYHGRNYVDVFDWILKNFRDEPEFLSNILSSVDDFGDGVFQNVFQEYNSETFVKFWNIIKEYKIILGDQFIRDLVIKKSNDGSNMLSYFTVERPGNSIREPLIEILSWILQEFGLETVEEVMESKDDCGRNFMFYLFSNRELGTELIPILNWLKSNFQLDLIKRLFFSKTDDNKSILSIYAWRVQKRLIAEHLINFFDWIKETFDEESFNNLIRSTDDFGNIFLNMIAFNCDYETIEALISILNSLKSYCCENTFKDLICIRNDFKLSIIQFFCEYYDKSYLKQLLVEFLQWIHDNVDDSLWKNILFNQNEYERNFLHSIFVKILENGDEIDFFDLKSEILLSTLNCLYNQIKIDKLLIENLLMQKDNDGNNLLNYIASKCPNNLKVDVLTEIISWVHLKLGSDTVAKIMKSKNNEGRNFIFNLCWNIGTGVELKILLEMLLNDNEFKLNKEIIKDLIFTKKKYEESIIHVYIATTKKESLEINLTSFINWIEKEFGKQLTSQLLQSKTQFGDTFINYIAYNNDYENIDSTFVILNLLKVNTSLNFFWDLFHFKNLFGQSIIHVFCENYDKKYLKNFLPKLLQWIHENMKESLWNEILFHQDCWRNNFLYSIFKANIDGEEDICDIFNEIVLDVFVSTIEFIISNFGNNIVKNLLEMKNKYSLNVIEKINNINNEFLNIPDQLVSRFNEILSRCQSQTN